MGLSSPIWRRRTRGGITGIFDSLTTGLMGAYSLRRLLTTTTRAPARLRRSSDGAEADINFSGLEISADEVNRHLRTQITGGRIYFPNQSYETLLSPDGSDIVATADRDIRIGVRLRDYTPSAINTLVAKWDNIAGNRECAFDINTSGNLVYNYSTDGATSNNRISTVAAGITDNTDIVFRITHDLDNGAGGNTTTFWTSTNYNFVTKTGTWTQVGSAIVVAGTIASYFNGTSPLQISGFNSYLGNQFINGEVFGFEYRIGIDGAIARGFSTSTLTANDKATIFTGEGNERWKVGSQGYNCMRSSNDLNTGSNWTALGSVTLANGGSVPTNRTGNESLLNPNQPSTQLIFPAVPATSSYIFTAVGRSATHPANQALTLNFKYRTISGTQQFRAVCANTGTWAGANVSPTLTATTTWQQYSATFTPTDGRITSNISFGSEQATPFTAQTGTLEIADVDLIVTETGRTTFFDSPNSAISTAAISGSWVSMYNQAYAVSGTPRMWFDAFTAQVNLNSTISFTGEFFVNGQIYLTRLGNSFAWMGTAACAIIFESATQIRVIHADNSSVDITVSTPPPLYTAFNLQIERNSSNEYRAYYNGVNVTSLVPTSTATFEISTIGVGRGRRIRGSTWDINIDDQYFYAGDGINNSNWTDLGLAINGTVIGSPVLAYFRGIFLIPDISLTQSTAAAQPLAWAGGMVRDNGKPTSYYDGTNDALGFSKVFPFDVDLAATYVVGREFVDNAGASALSMSFNTLNLRWYAPRNYTGNTGFGYGASATAITSASRNINSIRQWALSTTTVATAYSNNSSLGTSALVSGLDLTSAQAVGGVTGVGFWQGNIDEVLIYRAQHDATTVGQVYNAQKTYWGLP